VEAFVFKARSHKENVSFTMASGFKHRKLITTSVLIALMAYYLHKPLPGDMTQRQKLHFFEPFMRVVYFYPMKAFGYLGVSWQLMWTRNSLHYLAKLSCLVTLYDGGIKQTVDTSFSNVPVRVYIPTKRANDGAVFFIHGGGFVLMGVESYDSFVRQVVRTTNMVVVSVDYRLAPEHLFPAGLNDCEQAALSFLTEHYKDYQVNPNKVVIMGDSAGGNLATVVAQRMRNRPDLPSWKLQVLIYPVVQFVDMLTPSYQLIRSEVDGTALVEPESLARWLLVYLGIDTKHVHSVMNNNHTVPEVRRAVHFNYLSHDILPASFKRESSYIQPPSTYGDPVLYRQLEPFLFNSDFSPIMNPSLAGMPKSLVITCEYDPLRDEGYWYMQRMRDEGVDVDYLHYEHGFHAMLNLYTEIELGRKAFADIAKYILNNIDS